MMYWQFLALFIVPPLLLLAATLPGSPDSERSWARSLGIIAVLALIYTTPWDNYLVHHEIWSYGPNRVLATLGYVPVEEYIFFILQPVLTGLWLYHMLMRQDVFPPVKPGAPARGVGAGVFVFLGLVGFWLMYREGGRYLGLILVWAAPVLAGQWFYGGALFWRLRRLTLLAILIPTVYLWAVDRLALAQGIWRISASDTLGWSLFDLPIEEAVFFLLTNVMVVQGLLLLLYPPADQQRLPARQEAARTY